jgi:hypothetical protein
MSTVTSQPLSLLRIDFQELYARHLCRHSQFGINVAHLVALFATWFAVYALVFWLVRTEWVLIALAAAYLAVLALQIPARVLVATGLFLALFLAMFYWLPELPDWMVWVYLAMIPVFYKLQAWSHKVWRAAADMTEFDKKYPKGFVLFVILLFFEVPLVLNYLLFDRKSWTA